MNCTEAKRNILLADSGELPGNKRHELEAHVAACAECGDYERALQAIMAQAKPALAAAGPGPVILTGIRAAAEQGVPSRIVLFRRPFAQVLAYAALFLALLGGWLLFPTAIHTAGQLDEMNTLLAMVSEPDVLTEEAVEQMGGEQELRRLARQLLRMEGFVVDELPDEEGPTTLEALPSIDSQSHSTRGLLQKRCV